MYQPYQSPTEEGSNTGLRFLKLPNAHLPDVPEAENDEEQRVPTPLRTLQDLEGYSAVVLAGHRPSFILKSASSPPQIMPIRLEEAQSICSLSLSNCQKGFACITKDVRLNDHLFFKADEDRVISSLQIFHQALSTIQAWLPARFQ